MKITETLVILFLIHKHVKYKNTHLNTHTHTHYHTITGHLSVLHEEGIVLGDLDGEALGMEDQFAKNDLNCRKYLRR